MDSFDYTLLALAAVAALLGLTLIYFVVRSFMKIWQSRGLDSGWSAALKKAAAVMLVAGVILTIHFWLLNPHNDLDSVSYNPAGIAAGLSLVVVGVILTYLILPFHRKQVNKTKWPWLRRHKVTVGLCLVLATVIGVVVYQQLALRHNREAFVQARSAIDTVYADIVTKVGQPDNYRRTNDCSRPSQEFEQGPLSCHTDISFIYGVNNDAEANIVFKKIQLVISRSNVFKSTSKLKSSLSSATVINTTMYGAEDSYQIKGLQCVANYTYKTPTETDLKLKSDQQPLEVTLGCYGSARAQYYLLNQ